MKESKESYSTEVADSTVHEHVTSDEASYWNNFYQDRDIQQGSSFFECVTKGHELPSVVLDFGCGDGRDSFAFASEFNDKDVVGLDRSATAVDQANAGSHLDNLVFTTCDVSDENQVREIIKKVRGDSEKNVCFYMRFFLHSIPKDAQKSLLNTISECAQSGDVFAAEFRTKKDADQAKTHGTSHYRRYQNAEKFAHKIREKYGWKNILHEVESQGLAVYGDEDPYLYRVIAKRD